MNDSLASLLRPIMDLWEYDFARVSLVVTLLVCALSSLFSPVVVLRRRSSLVESTSHMVIPGVILGLWLTRTLNIPQWVAVTLSAGVCAFLGQWIQDRWSHYGNMPPEAISMLSVSVFVSLGILMLYGNSFSGLKPEQVLFGDILLSTWEDVWFLGMILVVSMGVIRRLKSKIDLWVSDAEYAQLMGIPVQKFNRLFSLGVTTAVLSCILSMGGMLVAGLFVLPCFYSVKGSVWRPNVILLQIGVGAFAWFLSFWVDKPLAPILVLLSLGLVILNQAGNFRKI